MTKKTETKNTTKTSKKSSKKVSKNNDSTVNSEPGNGKVCCKCGHFSSHPGFCRISKTYKARKSEACSKFKNN